MGNSRNGTRAKTVVTDTISRISDRVVDESHTWMTRPLGPIHAVIFIDVIIIKGA